MDQTARHRGEVSTMRRTIQRAILIAGLGVGATLGALALSDTAASADDKPAAVAERPGGALGRGLPGKPVRKLLGTVTDALPIKVTADKPQPDEPKADEPADEPTPPPAEPDPKPKPTRDPEPEPEPTRPAEPEPTPTAPADDHDTDQAPEPEPEPTETPPEPTTPAAPLCDVPLVDGVCQVVEDVVEAVPPVVVEIPPVVVQAPPVVIDVPPVVVVDVPPITVVVPPVVVDIPAVVVTLPSTSPATLPGAEDPQVQPAQPQTRPTPVLHGTLPAILGPTIGQSIATAAAAAAAAGELPAAALAAPMECGDLVTPTDAHYQAVLHRLDQLAAPRKPAARGKPGCPGTPGQPDQPDTGCDNATTGSSNSGSQHGQPSGDLTGGTVPPTLDRLAHTRARSHLPPSRHTCIEPGPA